MKPRRLRFVQAITYQVTERRGRDFKSRPAQDAITMNEQEFITGEEIGEKLLQSVREMKAELGQVVYSESGMDMEQCETGFENPSLTFCKSDH